MEKNLSTFAIAQMLHVDPGSVANWIDQQLLKAHRTPGGHRRVATEDLVKFLREHKMPIPPDLDAAPTRILIVDDEPAITQLVAKAIKASMPECDVIEAHDGFRAGTITASLKPDVVILDLRMPGMDGYEVCRLIKSQEDTRAAEVIAMTAFPSPESEQQILACGARVCLDKPLDIPALLNEIKTSL
ncbi:MAG TPA: response regulator [Phycisphaerae bacterium]|nr:response regulator [Phycisphaerae bacterium]